jgi:hypothetical protein
MSKAELVAIIAQVEDLAEQLLVAPSLHMKLQESHISSTRVSGSWQQALGQSQQNWWGL